MRKGYFLLKPCRNHRVKILECKKKSQHVLRLTVSIIQSTEGLHTQEAAACCAEAAEASCKQLWHRHREFACEVILLDRQPYLINHSNQWETLFAYNHTAYIFWPTIYLYVKHINKKQLGNGHQAHKRFMLFLRTKLLFTNTTQQVFRFMDRNNSLLSYKGLGEMGLLISISF